MQKREQESPSISQNSSRLLLVELIHAYHGSTAMECILMSSTEVTTLCKARTPQCEGQWLLNRNVLENFLSRPNGWDWNKALETFSQTWDLSRHVLLQKDPITPGARWHEMLYAMPTGVLDDPIEEYFRIKAATLPANFQKHGITELKLGYIMQWRPICLAKLSSHFKSSTERDAKDAELFELERMEDLVRWHKFIQNKEKILVVNYANLLWKSTETIHALERKFPELGTLDANFVPQMGRDVFPDNGWKVDGSVVEFGMNIPPESVGYSLKTGSCEGGNEGFMHLGPRESDRISSTLAYLSNA